MNDILRSYKVIVNYYGVIRVLCPDTDCNEPVVPPGNLGSVGSILDSAQQHQQEYHTNG